MTTLDAPLPRDLVASLADSLVEARSLEGLVRPLLELLEAVTGLESTYMTTIDTAAGVQHVVYARNSQQLNIPEGLTVAWADTLCKRALESGQTYTDDVAGCWGDSEAAGALGIATYASTPIAGPDGSVAGTLCAASRTRQPLRDGAGRVLRMFAHLIAQQMANERLVEQLREANALLERTSLTDVVTGLPNRRALMEVVERRLLRRERDGSDLLIAFIDLDGFKQINDRHGHEAGDRFLAEIGRALVRSHRADDFTARIGGDEFVVLCSLVSDGERAEASLHARLLAATRGRFDLGDCTVDYAGPSIGVVTARRDRRDPEGEIARADAAMYAVKRSRAAARA